MTTETTRREFLLSTGGVLSLVVASGRSFLMPTPLLAQPLVNPNIKITETSASFIFSGVEGFEFWYLSADNPKPDKVHKFEYQIEWFKKPINNGRSLTLANHMAEARKNDPRLWVAGIGDLFRLTALAFGMWENSAYKGVIESWRQSVYKGFVSQKYFIMGDKVLVEDKLLPGKRMANQRIIHCYSRPEYKQISPNDPLIIKSMEYLNYSSPCIIGGPSGIIYHTDLTTISSSDLDIFMKYLTGSLCRDIHYQVSWLMSPTKGEDYWKYPKATSLYRPRAAAGPLKIGSPPSFIRPGQYELTVSFSESTTYGMNSNFNIYVTADREGFPAKPHVLPAFGVKITKQKEIIN
jgi:hypothetical protein